MLTAINILRTLAFCEGFCFASERSSKLMLECKAIMKQQTETIGALRAQLRLLEADAWPQEAHHAKQ